MKTWLKLPESAQQINIDKIASIELFPYTSSHHEGLRGKILIDLDGGQEIIHNFKVDSIEEFDVYLAYVNNTLGTDITYDRIPQCVF